MKMTIPINIKQVRCTFWSLAALLVLPTISVAQSNMDPPGTVYPTTVVPAANSPFLNDTLAAMSARDYDPAFEAAREASRHTPPLRLYPLDPNSPAAQTSPSGSTAQPVAPGPSSGSAILSAQSVLTSYRGITDTTANPPDSQGAAGPSHYMEITNGAVAFFSKSTGTLLNQVGFVSFFGMAGLQDYYFDPRLLYDQSSGRFIALCGNKDSRNMSPYAYIVVAVSQSSDPTGGWYKYAVMVPTTLDYPTLGVDGSAIYSCTAISSTAARLTIISKAQLLNGGPIAAFSTDALPGNVFHPCHTFGNPGAEYIVGREPDGTHLRIYKLTNPTGPPTLTFLGFVTVPGFGGVSTPNASQAGGPDVLDGNDTRLLNAVYRNGYIYCSHHYNRNGILAARWYQVNPSALTLAQSGDITDGAHHYFYPSLAVNSAGDIGFGFSGSGTTQYVATYFTTHKATDPAGYTATPTIVKGGEAYYNRDPNNTVQRWGDYSGTCVDPSNDTNFWTVQEYAASPSGKWGTWITNFNTSGAASVFKKSRITISGILAHSNSNTVELNFNGALSSSVATQVEHYTVTINGVMTAVEGASYNAKTHTVTLSLREGRLHIGSKLKATWAGLEDTANAVLHGEVGPVTVD